MTDSSISIDGVDFIVANTDCQVLETSQATIKIHLGKRLRTGRKGI